MYTCIAYTVKLLNTNIYVLICKENQNNLIFTRQLFYQKPCYILKAMKNMNSCGVSKNSVDISVLKLLAIKVQAA